MHELSVTQGILDIALNAARDAARDAARGAAPARITAIDLLVGDLASFVDDSIQFYFDILSKNTAAEGALLRIRHEPASALCNACGHTFDAHVALLPACPACGSGRVRITGGRELRVESIEVEDGNPGGC